ncbi:MAG TPA: O-acetyl-ADP-ribose deacetylase [Gemmata sp.]|jgi:O-acetyl-ADP-ribose deacetylase (regulator of RNase III)|nr:O-acetyl-ADP-ribose deacetylase [Gemmata sp.]
MWNRLQSLLFSAKHTSDASGQGESFARGRLRLLVADITTLQVEAIVNAANESLLGGGGVDGAIHAAAGPELLKECRELGGCPTGQARLTKGYRLPARYVIHAVGPIYRDGRQGEEHLLQSCYREALKLSVENRLGSIAFPCISTGIFGYPKEEACRIAIATVRDWLNSHDLPREVVFCCYSAADGQVYRQQLLGTQTE